jgi:hypothetical protein
MMASQVVLHSTRGTFVCPSATTNSAICVLSHSAYQRSYRPGDNQTPPTRYCRSTALRGALTGPTVQSSFGPRFPGGWLLDEVAGLERPSVGQGGAR